MPYFFRKNRRGFPVFLYRWIVARCKMGSASCTHDRCAQRLESNSSGKNRNCTLPKNTYMSGILALYSLLLGRKFSIIVSKEFSRYMAAPLGKPQEGCAASFPPLHKKTGEAAATPAFFLFRPISGKVPGLLPLQRPPAAASRQPPPTHSASLAASSIVRSRTSPNTFPTKKHLPPKTR